MKLTEQQAIELLKANDFRMGTRGFIMDQKCCTTLILLGRLLPVLQAAFNAGFAERERLANEAAAQRGRDREAMID